MRVNHTAFRLGNSVFIHYVYGIIIVMVYVSPFDMGKAFTLIKYMVTDELMLIIKSTWQLVYGICQKKTTTKEHLHTRQKSLSDANLQ